MANATGTATIDFGAVGANEASVVVTGQTGISTTSKVEAFVMADNTSSNRTANDHRYLGLFAAFTCGSIVNGTGFTIYGVSSEKLTGQYTLNWVWAD